MIKNKIFQAEWSIEKSIIPRKTGETPIALDAYSQRFVSQISHAQKYSPSLIIIGDSNGENLTSETKMDKLGDLTNRVCMNIAIGGTRADTWVDFFTKSSIGLGVYSSIRNLNKVIFNIGGNNVLQKQMDILGSNLRILKTLFPMSYNCLIPPIHYGILESTGFWEPGYLESSVTIANDLIKSIWGFRTIDTYSPFVDPSTNEAYILYDGKIESVTQDPVHFSDDCDMKVRIPLISAWVNL